jgi:flagellar biosynthesis protein FlhF
MLVKVFESHEMSSALKMVKETLGPDALILSTRTIRKGGLGVFGKPILEVTAAVESPALASELPTPPVPQRTALEFPPVEDAEEEITYRDLWKKRKVVDPLEEEVREIKMRLANENFSALKEELEELKGLVRQANLREREIPAARPATPVATPRAAMEGTDPLEAALARGGMDPDAAGTIGRFAAGRWPQDQVLQPGGMKELLDDAIGELVPVTGSLFPAEGEQKRIALVGPTGVGKTTTIAKLAADYVLNGFGKVALITIDTYRIAAVEQIKVYAEIMNLPVEVVLSPDQLQAAFEKHEDKDLILIDTAGRNPRDEVRLEELALFFGPDCGVSTHLVLAAPTRERELQETVRRFGRLNPESLVFTKLDECENCGALLNIPVHSDFPISYLTNGQRVPEDLLVADRGIVAGYVMGGSKGSDL